MVLIDRDPADKLEAPARARGRRRFPWWSTSSTGPQVVRDGGADRGTRGPLDIFHANAGAYVGGEP